jgi:hypothetical protein
LIRGKLRKLSKTEIRDYAKTLVPVFESHEVDGTKDARIVDAVISYAFKGTRSWLRRASALQGFIGPRMSILEGYLIFPTQGIEPVTIQSTALENSYLVLDIIGAGGGGGGGGGGNTTANTTYGQGGGGGGDGGRLIVRTQGPLVSGTKFTAQLGGLGGQGGPPGTNGSPGSSPSGATQVVLGNGSLTLSVQGAPGPTMPPTAGGQQAGGAGGAGGSAVFTYLPTTPIFSAIQLGPRTSFLANYSAVLDQGIGGDGVGSEYFTPSNTAPIFVSTPQGARVAGGNPGATGTSATANVPANAIPLRGSGAGGGGGTNNSSSPTTGGNGGSGGPGPIIILVIG